MRKDTVTTALYSTIFQPSPQRQTPFDDLYLQAVAKLMTGSNHLAAQSYYEQYGMLAGSNPVFHAYCHELCSAGLRPFQVLHIFGIPGAAAMRSPILSLA
jgi:hypothetical protein